MKKGISGNGQESSIRTIRSFGAVDFAEKMINVAQFRCIHRKAGREVLDAAVAAPDDHLSFNTERDSKVVRPALPVQNPPHAALSALSTRELHDGSSSLSIFFVQHVNRSHQ